MLKKFTHKNIPICDLKTKDVNGNRWYILPDGKLVPSVTTILSYFESESLQKWKDRVGEEESNRVKYRASRRGTSIHEMIEKYLNNEVINEVTRPDLFQMFSDMLPAVDRIDNIYCQETVLYSNMVAGRTDVIGEFDGVPSVIDFKTSTKLKQEKYITNYKEQSSKYAELFECNTGIPIKQAVIIIGVDNEPEPQIFKLDQDEIKKYQQSFDIKLRIFWGSQNAQPA